MIEFEVTETPDLEMKGPHTHYKRLLYFGNLRGDLLFQDPEIIDHHLRLEFGESGLFCYKNKKISHYLVNGKRTIGKKQIKINDELKIGSTSILIKNYLFPQLEKKGARIKKNLNLILTDPSMGKVKEIIEILEQDLAKLS